MLIRIWALTPCGSTPSPGTIAALQLKPPFLTGVAKALAARLSFLRRAEPGTGPRARLNTRVWSLELLKHLEWRRFEELCVAYYEATGLKTRIAGTGTQGGIDIILYETRSDEPIALARCKAWDAYRVGVKPVRDLRKAMDEAKITNGVLLAAGRFAQEAYALADPGIELVEGTALLERIAALPEEKSLGLLEFVTEGDFRTPTCPLCQIKMVQRRSTLQGRAFWGCPNYPACKQTFPVNPDLPPA